MDISVPSGNSTRSGRANATLKPDEKPPCTIVCTDDLKCLVSFDSLRATKVSGERRVFWVYLPNLIRLCLALVVLNVDPGITDPGCLENCMASA